MQYIHNLSFHLAISFLLYCSKRLFELVTELNGKINLNKLSEESWKSGWQFNTSYQIESDGFLNARVNFSKNTGFFNLIIKDNAGDIKFSVQINCGAAINRSYESGPVPVKTGWTFRVDGEDLNPGYTIKTTHF